MVRGHDAVIHAAAIPEPTSNAPHTVSSNTLVSTYKVLEVAGVRGRGEHAVVPNADGSEVVFTVLRSPGATGDAFARDLALAEQNLQTLRDLLEQS